MDPFERIELMIDDYPALTFRKNCLRLKAFKNNIFILFKASVYYLLENYKESCV